MVEHVVDHVVDHVVERHKNVLRLIFASSKVFMYKYRIAAHFLLTSIVNKEQSTNIQFVIYFYV